MAESEESLTDDDVAEVMPSAVVKAATCPGTVAGVAFGGGPFGPALLAGQ